MGKLNLPVNAETGQSQKLPPARRYTIIGSNGAGKSRFMEEMVTRTKGTVAVLSPISDTLPFQPVPDMEYMLRELASGKSREAFEAVNNIWMGIFEGSRMEATPDGVMFANESDEYLFDARRLSRGEKSAVWFLAAMAGVPAHATVFVDSPTLFLHPAVSSRFWDKIEEWRSDCVFVYDTSDPLFTASRPGTIPIWIKSYRKAPESWDYSIVQEEDQADEFMLNLLGSRRPVLFIEGDANHSIDFRLYSAVFREYTVKPVGSCNKVIEATRTFSSLNRLHRLESHGLVDRDRRTEAEVSYLRMKNVMVPEVAEVENIFLAEDILRIMAERCHRNPDIVFIKVKKEVVDEFRRKLEQQALQHTRHRMKRDVERKIDARFSCITALELHIKSLVYKLQPRETYGMLLKQFHMLERTGDYAGILKVFNDKTLFRQSCAIPLLGFSNPEEYVAGVLLALHGEDEFSERLREAIRKLFMPSYNTSEPIESDFVKHIEGLHNVKEDYGKQNVGDETDNSGQTKRNHDKKSRGRKRNTVRSARNTRRGNKGRRW